MPITIQHTILWLGDQIGDLFAVQIRKNKSNLGWLYQDFSMVIYRLGDEYYECSVRRLKELAESKLSERIFVSGPEPNRMIKTVEVEITGFLNLLDVMEISKKIEL